MQLSILRSAPATLAPKVMIGLPVYNGENYLEQALQSILAQTYTNLQVIVGDNASSDRTEEIIRSYMAQDDRILYYRHEHNIGAAPNYNFVFQKALERGATYFKWAAHDDLMAPSFVESCVEVLERNPSLAIAHSRALSMEADGEISGNFDYEIRLDGKTAADRFMRIMWTPGYFTEIFGVMRVDLMRQTRLQGSFAGSDRSFMAEMLLLGSVGYVERYLFTRRDHPQAYCHMKNKTAQLLWYDTSRPKLMAYLAGPLKVWYALESIVRTSLNGWDKVQCIEMLMEWGMRRTWETLTGTQGHYGQQLCQKFSAPTLPTQEMPEPMRPVNAIAMQEA
ncbi:MAG: glycosyltransferase family A protein [Synechococcales bacterium]|nr:glycosyltransferase family A protein [Synechococcales bacterium]